MRTPTDSVSDYDRALDQLGSLPSSQSRLLSVVLVGLKQKCDEAEAEVERLRNNARNAENGKSGVQDILQMIHGQVAEMCAYAGADPSAPQDSWTLRDRLVALVRERDEARAEVEVLRAAIDGEPWGAAVLKRERDEARADLREFVRQTEDAYALLKPLEDDSDAVERAVGHLLTILRGRERPGPWAFDAVLKQRDEARANYQWMVDRAADEHLDGHRELCAKCAQLEQERDHAWKLLSAHEWVTDGRESLSYCLHCGRGYNDGHADDCEVFGPGGFITPEVRHG